MTRVRTLFPDALATGILLATSLVIAWPILQGGQVTYIDNPAHLAEAHSLAHDAFRGWSEAAYCGFPLGTLHSPLWYGLLAGLARTGLPLDPLYALLVWFGFLAPCLALYAVARRRIRPLPAAMLAYILLIQRPAMVGLGSALGGMWTFYLASAALLLLADRLHRPLRSGRDLAWLAGLYALIGLTHLFALVPAALLFLIQAARAVLGPSRLAGLGRHAGAALLGAAAAALYWLPVLLAREHRVIDHEPLSGGLLMLRLLLPTQVLGLLGDNIDQLPIPDTLYYTDALPMVLLVAGGLAGGLIQARARDAREPGDRLPLHGLLLALGIILLLTAVAPVWTEVQFLGPVSWRLLYFARLGLGLAAIPVAGRLLAGMNAGELPRGLLATLALIAMAGGAWWGRPLALTVAPARGPEMDEVRALWTGLRQRRDSTWGRVYLQDTMLTPPFNRRLGIGHVLALTARQSGIWQLGGTYGITPFRTGKWTASELGQLYDRPLRTRKQFVRLLRRMRRTNATHLVLSEPTLGAKLATVPSFSLLLREGRFTLLRLTRATSRWVEAGSPGVRVGPVDFRPGRVRILVASRAKEAALLVKVSYSPYWRLTGGRGARLTGQSDGLMAIEGLAPGRHDLRLEYRPPRYPNWISLAGWLLIAGLALLGSRAGRRYRPTAHPPLGE